MKYPLIGCAFLASLAATSTMALTSQVAQDATNASIGTLFIQDAFTRPTASGATVALGYLAITNEGSAPDRLVAVNSDFSKKAEIQDSDMHELQDGVEIPAGATVDIKPDGNHIAFLDIKRPVKIGDIIHATLGFENAGRVDIGFKAEANIDAKAAKH